MARKKTRRTRRSSGLGFTPEKHFKNAVQHARFAKRDLRHARQAVKRGDCDSAIRLLMEAALQTGITVADAGAVRSHRKFRGARSVVQLRKLERKVRAACRVR